METLKRRDFPNTIPNTIDVSLTGKCQLNCMWCWGEKHAVGTVHNEHNWKKLLHGFSKSGTSHVVFTGGEPLLSSILHSVLRYAKDELSMRTTLSTNGILLVERHLDVLPWVDDVGIPLDGSTAEMNNTMRTGNIDNFQSAIDSMRLVQDIYPNISLTVRTVIARPNINDVQNIPHTLKNNGVDISKIRYKLYQVELIGPRTEEINTDTWIVDEDECRLVESIINEQHPELSVKLQVYSATSGRYYQIGPRGNAYGTYINKHGFPSMVDLGNPMQDYEHALEMLVNNYSYHSTH